MVRAIARYGFRSGVLPKPRQTVPRIRAPFELAEDSKVKNGFSDPAMAPKGVHPKPPSKQITSVQETIARTAKEPFKAREPKTELQRMRFQRADVRRKYLVEALESEQAQEEKRAKNRQVRHDKAREYREKLDAQEESPVSKLMMPSIESSLLAGSMIVPRSAAEKRLLQLKREANRKQAELGQIERRNADLLELYQSARDFILTPAELDIAVDKAFAKTDARLTSPQQQSLMFKDRNVQDTVARNEGRQRQEELAQTLMGVTSNNEPGLGEVRDALDGSWQTLLTHEAAAAAALEKSVEAAALEENK